MSNWLGNVPAARQKFNKTLPKNSYDKLESLLAFIQRAQPDATMDHLVEELLEAFFRKQNTSFPVAPESVSLKVTLPEDLIERVDAHVEDARASNPRADVTDLLEFAVEAYFSRSTTLLKAWRKDESASDGEAGESSEAESAESTKTSTPAPKKDPEESPEPEEETASERARRFLEQRKQAESKAPGVQTASEGMRHADGVDSAT